MKEFNLYKLSINLIYCSLVYTWSWTVTNSEFRLASQLWNIRNSPRLAKTTRWCKIFVFQVFARSFTKIEHPKRHKGYKIGSEDLQGYGEKFINDISTICVKI